MSHPAAYLVTGPEELLVRREAERVIAELTAAAGGEIDLTDVRAADVAEHGLPDLQTGSLFGAPRVVRIRDAEELGAEAQEGLRRLLDGPAPEGTLVLTASGTGRIRSLADRIGKLGGRVDAKPPPDWDAGAWQRLAASELARHERDPDADAVQSLLDHAGYDAAALAEKAAQVAAAAPPGRITAAQVDDLVVGHGSRGAFAVADAMCEGDAAGAVRLLRGVLEGGNDPVMVLGALAYRIRAIVAVAGRVATKEQSGLGISSGQAGHLQRARRGFGPGQLTHAYRHLADADAAIKGSDLPPAAVLEQTVVAIASREPPASTARR